ncbi:MAG: S9 family peptidase, partial [Defluviitaleaceae bacterium]|nr:S9 family peptidase [Defluviitaleaceae bacterium]
TDIPNIFSVTRILDEGVMGIMRRSGGFTEEQIQAVSDCGFGDTYNCYKKLLGGRDPRDAKELCESASVMQYVSKNTPPYYIIQSDADDAVPVGHALKLYIAMREAKADVELKIVPNANHGLCNDIDGNMDLSPVERIFSFFAEKLGIEGYDPNAYPPKTENY